MNLRKLRFLLIPNSLDPGGVPGTSEPQDLPTERASVARLIFQERNAFLALWVAITYTIVQCNKRSYHARNNGIESECVQPRLARRQPSECHY